MIGVETKFTDIHKVISFLQKAQSDTAKNYNTAVRVEGFRLKSLLQKEIRSGAPGGRRFNDLAFLARKWKGHRRNNPLNKLAYGVRYTVSSTDPMIMKIGFVGPLTPGQAKAVKSADIFGRGINAGQTTSKSYRRLAKKHQEGFTQPVTPSMRKYIIRRGAELGKIEGGMTPFFLKKSTTHFKTPARPIITPFWNRYERTASSNIVKNFRKKMSGGRI